MFHHQLKIRQVNLCLYNTQLMVVFMQAIHDMILFCRSLYPISFIVLYLDSDKNMMIQNLLSSCKYLSINSKSSARLVCYLSSHGSSEYHFFSQLYILHQRGLWFTEINYLWTYVLSHDWERRICHSFHYPCNNTACSLRKTDIFKKLETREPFLDCHS